MTYDFKKITDYSARDRNPADQGSARGDEEEHRSHKAQNYGLKYTERVPLSNNPSVQSDHSCSTCGTGMDNEVMRLVSREAEDMLINSERKIMSLTELYNHMGLSGYKGNKCKNELIKQGLAFEVALPTNRRGRKKKILQMTPKGRNYLKEIGVEIKRKGRGGIKHLYFQKIVVEWYESDGYTADI